MAERLIIFISIAIGTTGIKLKKKVTDGTTITTTEYMQGFQYTNNALDFFPHTSTALSAGSGGYVKALAADLGGGTSYDFKYVFTYTDHLGNIRLKYAQDPSNNNRISILEEDHYYPYGLKHSGYNSFHQIFTTEDGDLGPGTGIVLTPVNPFLGDSHKYKFGGMEYQDEFDINTYDFGARNYDPALGRWMNIDPMAEMMRRHSPYNYAFNNPVYFIDPDGMMAGGFANINPVTSTGSMDVIGGYDVNTVDKENNVLSTEYHANVNDAGNAAAAIDSNIDRGGSSNVASLTNKRNIGGIEGLSMGADGVGNVRKAEDHPFRATLVIDKSVPSDLFSDISVIREDDQVGKDRTFHPTKHGSINGVDGLFLRNQPESKTWYKISDYSEATIYYNSDTGLDIKDTTGKFHPVRLSSSYYVDWVDKNDEKRKKPTKNPFTYK